MVSLRPRVKTCTACISRRTEWRRPCVTLQRRLRCFIIPQQSMKLFLTYATSRHFELARQFEFYSHAQGSIKPRSDNKTPSPRYWRHVDAVAHVAFLWLATRCAYEHRPSHTESPPTFCCVVPFVLSYYSGQCVISNGEQCVAFRYVVRLLENNNANLA